VAPRLVVGKDEDWMVMVKVSEVEGGPIEFEISEFNIKEKPIFEIIPITDQRD
jgi:hypothetical protein